MTADSLERGATSSSRPSIRYRRADQSTAAWLHKAIETYSIPKELRGTACRDGPIPKQLFPVFRDRDALSSCPDLSRSIHEALQASAYLIVLCSPAAGRSKWVNQEIIEFKKLGRSDRIHALIVEGDPAAAVKDGGIICTSTAVQAWRRWRTYSRSDARGAGRRSARGGRR